MSIFGKEIRWSAGTSQIRRSVGTSESTTSVRLEDRGGLLLDALCRHREILRRETDFLRGEVSSRGFLTFAGKKAYIESDAVPPFGPFPSAPRSVPVRVSLPYLVASPQESLDLLLHELHHLSYRIQSLASISRERRIRISLDKVKRLGLIRMPLADLNISHIIAGKATRSPRPQRAPWESAWGSPRAHNHGAFDDITTLSPMLFTPTTPGFPPSSATICPALQIYSFKIVQLNVNLKWPLRVYGIVSARDSVDHNRNLLFYRSRANFQLVTENDPFLRLTGPSRAIVSLNPVIFEVELKIEYPGAGGQDLAFFYRTYNWRSMRDTTPLFMGYPCAAELSLEQLPRAIQATIVGVRLVEGQWPSTHGCRIFCSLSTAEDMEVELLNSSSLDEVKISPVGSDNYFGLARNVVSAQLQSTLKVVIQAKWKKMRSGGLQHTHVEFPVRQYCQTSKASCRVVGCDVEVVVAWSFLVDDKLDLMLEG